jgi:adenosylhomocysteine nucleosidase
MSVMTITWKRVGLLAPMKNELAPLVKKLSLRRETRDGLEVHVGRIGDTEVLATLTRIGVEEAKNATERMLDVLDPDHVVVVGICGGIGANVKVGDLIVPEVVVDHTSGAEYTPTTIGNTPAKGRLITTATFMSEGGMWEDLATRGYLAVDMETSAVAEVCERRGTPWSAFRAVSDHTAQTTSEGAEITFVNPDGSPRFGQVLKYVARHPGRIAHLARIGKGSVIATNLAATSAIDAIRTTQSS